MTKNAGSFYHQRLYLGLLIFVVGAGLPVIGVPPLRHRLSTRVEVLRAAALGKPVLQPATAQVGSNTAPFPKEYERPKYEPPAILPKFEAPARPAFHIIAGSGSGDTVLAPVPRKNEPKPEKQVVGSAAAETQAPASSGPEHKKGKSEQEAYDILVNTIPVLAGMIKGSDPDLKFQDWSAAGMGQDSFNVSLTFLHSGDNGVRKYIWNVKVETKAVMPLSAYAREISK